MTTPEVNTATAVEDAPVLPGEYDPKQKYITVTVINHGYVDADGAQQLIVPSNVEFSKYASNFNSDELNAFVAQGTIAPMSDVNSDISDENDALKAELEASEFEKQSLAQQVADLQAQLEAAKKAPPAK